MSGGHDCIVVVMLLRRRCLLLYRVFAYGVSGWILNEE